MFMQHWTYVVFISKNWWPWKGFRASLTQSARVRPTVWSVQHMPAFVVLALRWCSASLAQWEHHWSTSLSFSVLSSLCMPKTRWTLCPSSFQSSTARQYAAQWTIQNQAPVCSCHDCTAHVASPSSASELRCTVSPQVLVVVSDASRWIASASCRLSSICRRLLGNWTNSLKGQRRDMTCIVLKAPLNVLTIIYRKLPW